MSSGERTAVSVDTDFIKSRPGLARIFQIVVSICGLICISSAYCWHPGRFGFFDFVAIVAIIYPLAVLIIFLFRVHEQLARCLNVPLTLLINDIIYAILYFIASILVFITYCYYSNVAVKIAGVFGLLGVLLFLYTAYLSYQSHQVVVVRKTTTTTTVVTP